MKDKDNELIVADSSVIINCARANKLWLIESIYSKIVIPPAVYREVVIEGMGKPGSEEIKSGISVWLEIKEPEDKNFVHKIQQRLGSGESEAIVLSRELNGVLLADEGKAINEARKYGIRIKSTLLMLLDAKDRGLISSVKTELNELIASGFRCSDGLYKRILKASKEFR